MSGPLVSLQVSSALECFGTFFAFKWKFSSVSFHVSLEVSFVFELCCAHLTGVGLLLGLRGGRRPGHHPQLPGEDAVLRDGGPGAVDDHTATRDGLQLDNAALRPVLSDHGATVDNVDCDGVDRSNFLRSRLY